MDIRSGGVPADEDEWALLPCVVRLQVAEAIALGPAGHSITSEIAPALAAACTSDSIVAVQDLLLVGLLSEAQRLLTTQASRRNRLDGTASSDRVSPQLLAGVHLLAQWLLRRATST